MKQGNAKLGSGSAMMKAMEKAAKKMPAVHQLPKKKEPKKLSAVETSENYWPPNLYLGTEDFPGIANWQAGDTVTLVITAKVKSVSINQHEKSKARHSADLELSAISDITVGKGGKGDKA